jgi:hypothetical protein
MAKQKRAARALNREPISTIVVAIPLLAPTPIPVPNLSQIDPCILRASSVASTRQFSPFSDHESIIDTQYLPLPLSPTYAISSAEDYLDSDIPRPVATALATTTTLAISTDNTTTLSKLPKVQWNTQMIGVMIEELLHQVELGKRADSGFKKEAWAAVCAMVQTVTTQPLIELQCKTKMETLRDLWKGLNWLLDQSGFGYDEEVRLVTAPDNVWADLRKVLSLTYYYI